MKDFYGMTGVYFKGIKISIGLAKLILAGIIMAASTVAIVGFAYLSMIGFLWILNAL